MESIVKHLDDINEKINNHYESIYKLRAEKQKIYNKKFYKINKSIIIEKVQIKKKGKYIKKKHQIVKFKKGRFTLTF